MALASILVADGIHLTLFKPFDSLAISGPITVLWIVGLTNSFNFLDNMDGLAAGVGLIAASLFVAAQVEVEGRFVPAVLLVLVGALGGFLVHNRHPARLFMGDAGSNFLGFLLGTLTVVGTFTRPAQGYSPYGVLTPLLVMAVPLYDTTSVILIRIREGRSPFEADRRHFSHRLVDRGLTPPLAVRTIYLVTLAGGLGALLLPRPWMDASGACVVVAPDGLPARGGGPPRSLHEPAGASRCRGETHDRSRSLRTVQASFDARANPAALASRSTAMRPSPGSANSSVAPRSGWPRCCSWPGPISPARTPRRERA